MKISDNKMINKFLALFIALLSFTVKGHSAGLVPEKHPKTDLAKTELGRAVKKGVFSDIWGELTRLQTLPPDEALEILQAKDSKGNNIFHLLAEKSNPELVGLIPYLSLVLTEFNDWNTVDNWNESGHTPKDTALSAGNTLAVEYLIEAENMVKKLRGDGLPATEKTNEETHERIKAMIRDNRTLGIATIVNGVVFFDLGMRFDYFPPLLALGAFQIIVGARVCKRAFSKQNQLKN